MSQGFKLKYEQLQENNPAKPDEKPQSYTTAGHVRNVCFTWPDGRAMFLNYSYLISGEYLPEENKIILTFTTHTITLTGIRLKTLFEQLLHHLPMHITCMEERYNETTETTEAIVNEIHVAENS
jgi:hypothetical protein